MGAAKYGQAVHPQTAEGRGSTSIHATRRRYQDGSRWSDHPVIPSRRVSGLIAVSPARVPATESDWRREPRLDRTPPSLRFRGFEVLYV